ncbi:PLxRFG domain-containing protein [Acinetobacter thermotolerans]|uniref:PLxRFG domain-containing protein n=1 Tax=Acinetobacter thermotolerans TaxID=3151487 RepID=UPI00325AF3B4
MPDSNVDSKQKKPLDPSRYEPIQTNQVDGFNPANAEEVKKGFGGHAKDLGVSLAAGAAAIPDIAIGLGDILTGGAVGKAIDDSGLYKTGSGAEYWNDKKTDVAKEQSQQFSDAEGIWDKTKVALSNPTLITNTVAESLPTMVAGGLVGRGLNAATKGAISPMVGGAIGEGTMMAGGQAEQIRQQTDDGLLNNNQVAASVATGALGTLFGMVGGAVAKKFGFGDVDSMLAGANANQIAGEISKIPLKSVPKHVIAGALSEGLLEELPQSVQEQVLQNYALNKDLMDGVDDAIVMGTLAGMAMGGTASGLNVRGHNQRYNAQEQLKAAQQQEQADAEQQAMRDTQAQIFGSDTPAPVLDPSKLNPFSDNTLPASPVIDMERLAPADGNPRYENGVNFQPTPVSPELTLVDDNQVIQSENGIDFVQPEREPTALERQIQFNDTFGTETPAPVLDYNSVSPFNSNTQQPILDATKLDLAPSQRMGIDPNTGPLSAAAATAVDTGVSQQFQIEAQAQALLENKEGWDDKQGDTDKGNIEQAADAARELTPEQIHGKQNTYGADVTAAIERIKQQGVLSSGNTSEFLSANDGSQPNTEQSISTNDNGTGATAQQSAQDNAGTAQAGTEVLSSPETASAVQIDQKIAQVEQQFQTEKSVPKKAQLRKKLENLKAHRSEIAAKQQVLQADAATAQNAQVIPQGGTSTGYQLPESSKVVHDEWFGSRRKDFTPNARQQKLIEATRQALSELEPKYKDGFGTVSNRELNQRVAEILKVPEADLARGKDQVQGGDFGSDVYLARNYIESQAQVKAQNEAAKIVKPKAGQKIGNVRFNDGSSYRNVQILSVDGDTIRFSGTRGNKKYESTTSPSGLKAGVERAFEMGQRADNPFKQAPTQAQATPAQAPVQGKTEKVYTPGTNREIEVRHKVVEADDLITSHDASGVSNPKFPQQLQPRDRARPTSIAQIHDISNKLNPKLLGENPSTASGAPIVSADGVVESGNGRTLAIRKAYETGKGEAYKQWLSEQGYDVSGMKNPVLVRERVTPLNDDELLDYTRESNESTTLSMSPTEQAMVDAKAVIDLLDLYRGGDITSAANRDFVNRFVTEIVPTSERGKMLSAGTGLTQDGQRRINAALVAAAYNDTFIVDQVFESTESDIKAIGNALTDIAGYWARMRDAAENGLIPKDLDVTPNLVEAVHLVQKARVTNTKLADLVAQDDIFSGAVDPVTLDFLSVFYRGDKYTRARGRERVADALNHYAQQAMQQSNGENLFGEKPKTNTQLRGETLDRINQQEADKQQDIFASTQPDDANTGATGGAGQRTTAQGANAETSERTAEVKTNYPEKPESSKAKETIQDFGEKIGGARKDTAVKTGKKATAEKQKDDRPTWAKRFEISEIAASSNPAEVGKWIISDTKSKDWMGNSRRVTKTLFDSKEQAEKFLPIAAVAMKHRVTSSTVDDKKGFIIVRDVSDRKRVQVVQQMFDTRDAANEYLVRHAQEILETNTTFGELDLPRPENTQRTGVPRREGDAKDSDFSRVFGFRGVEFGNWNNQAERQELLNDAFDGLMDLAEVLNVPPEALSLNGELALAFGARGQGLSSAKAHYESERVVINLTKMNGAGSLAHEWWHAFDHYLSRQDGSASSAWIQHADGSRSLKVSASPADRFASHGFRVVKSGVREDVRQAFENLMVTMFKKSQAYVEDTQEADEFVARARDEVQEKLNAIRENLARQLDPKYYKRFNKPASADQLAEFDTAAELIITGQLLETEARKNPNSRSAFGSYRYTNDALDKINEIFKAVRGRSGFNSDFKGVLDYLRGSMSRYMGRLKMLAEAQQSTTKYRSIPTEFAMNAKELDQGRGSDYWTTPHEMSARAFQGYVEDKIAAKNARSPFLNYGPENVGILTPYGVKRPFPYGEERVAINQAFDQLISGLQTEKTDTGTRLYSRADGEKQAGQTPEQVREVLVKRFGEKTISSLERRGLLDIVSTINEPGVEGFYQNGRVTLVADNLTETSIIPTFLHELGGHGGFQNFMNKEQYAELMRMFNDMVERKHPIALEAKRLAEREQDNETQQLEYLPYLLTLASTRQEMNALQKSALRRFVDKVISAVKAWLFDRLGINLNLNEDDMLVLANRVIQQQINAPTSEDIVRAKYRGSKEWMKAPNGKPTNLTEQQWLQVRTPEFKAWFGDWENNPETASKIVDENGEPKVVYHGTSAKFTRFNLGGGLLGRGVYLTDQFQEAENYAGSRSNGVEGTVLPLFANIRDVFETTAKTTREQILTAAKKGFNGIRHQFDDMSYMVAFKPEQVKLAVGNTGLFNSRDDDIRYSRTANAQQIVQNIVSNMNKQGAAKLREKAAFKMTDALQYLLQGLGRRQLTEIYSKILPQMKRYNDIVAQMDADKNEIAANADGIVEKWSKLKDEKELAAVMHEATLAQIDPAKPYQPGDSVAKYAQLKKAFDALSPEAKAMYKEARDAYKKHHRDVRAAIRDRILRSSMSNQKKTELLQQMDAHFFGYAKGVYFPLQRFGKYVVLVRDRNGQVLSVSRAETMAEAQKLREVLKEDYPNDVVNKPILDKDFQASRDMVGRGFMTNLFNELGSFGLNAQRQAELEDILGQLYLKSLPDLSYAKHSIHRKGTAGFSQDARRAFAQNMQHGASYLAKLRYKDQLEDLLDGMQKHADDQAKTNPDYDQPVAQRVINEMNKRHESLMSPDSHPLSSALTSLGFLYYLGLSPASAAVNTLQTVLVAYPQMGAKWGYDKAGAALIKAANDFRKGVSINGLTPKNWESDIAKVLKGDELKAYTEAVRRGTIDVTMAHDLAGVAQGEDSGVMWKLRPIMRIASALFHHAERFNREVTFIAAYRLSRESGMDHDNALEQAIKSTYDGHFDYSSSNRPRIMQGNVAKVILLFKQFGQNMLYTLARTTQQIFKGETLEVRREALRSMVGILAMHGLFAGALGLPMVTSILGIVSFLASLSIFGGSDDEPWDAEVALRNALADALGVKTAEVLMRGVPRLGPADLSGRVGINNLLMPDVQDGLEGKEFSDAAVAAALGPVVGILTNIFKGLNELGEGHGMRGVETMAPVFARSPLRAYRYATDGNMDKTGVMINEEVSGFGVMFQAMGFSPSEVRLASEGRGAIFNHTRRLDARRSELMSEFARAMKNGDKEEQDAVWAEIQAFNEKNPSRRINRIQAMQSLRQREKRVREAENGVYLPRKKRDDADIGRFAFDE